MFICSCGHLIAMFTVLALTAVKLSLISLKQFCNSRNWASVTLTLVSHNRDRKCDGKIRTQRMRKIFFWRIRWCLLSRLFLVSVLYMSLLLQWCNSKVVVQYKTQSSSWSFFTIHILAHLTDNNENHHHHHTMSFQIWVQSKGLRHHHYLLLWLSSSLSWISWLSWLS